MARVPSQHDQVLSEPAFHVSGGALQERPSAAAKDGFAGIEMTFPYDHAADEVRAAADRAGVAAAEFNAPAGSLEPGVRRGLAAVPEHQRKYLDQVREGRLCARLRRQTAPVAYRRRLSRCNLDGGHASLCAPFGAALIIETNNLRDNPNYLLRTLAEACEVIGRVEWAYLRIVLDFLTCADQLG
jgi:hydroxypyruvate isomerase